MKTTPTTKTAKANIIQPEILVKALAKHSDLSEPPSPPPLPHPASFVEEVQGFLKTLGLEPAQNYYLSTPEIVVAEDALLRRVYDGSLQHNYCKRRSLCHEAFSLAIKLASPQAMAPRLTSRGSEVKPTTAELRQGKHVRILDVERELSKVESKRGNCGFASFIMRTLALCFQSTFGSNEYEKFKDARAILALFSQYLGRCSFDEILVKSLTAAQREAAAWTFHAWCKEFCTMGHHDMTSFQFSLEKEMKQKVHYKNLLNIFLNDEESLHDLAWGGNPRVRLDNQLRYRRYNKAACSLTGMMRRKFLAARLKAGLRRYAWDTSEL